MAIYLYNKKISGKGGSQVVSVNNQFADDSGNVQLYIPHIDSTVVSVNSVLPDENGNVELDPVTLGCVASVNEQEPDSYGNITLDAEILGIDPDEIGAIPATMLDRASGVAVLNSNRQLNEERIPDLSSTYLTTEKAGAANGVATLDANGKINDSQLPSLDYVPNTEKGEPGGVATLGSDGKVISAQLPAAIPQVFQAGTTAPSDVRLLWIDTTATTGGLKYYNGSAWVHVPVAFS